MCTPFFNRAVSQPPECPIRTLDVRFRKRHETRASSIEHVVKSDFDQPLGSQRDSDTSRVVKTLRGAAEARQRPASRICPLKTSTPRFEALKTKVTCVSGVVMCVFRFLTRVSLEVSQV